MRSGKDVLRPTYKRLVKLNGLLLVTYAVLAGITVVSWVSSGSWKWCMLLCASSAVTASFGARVVFELKTMSLPPMEDRYLPPASEPVSQAIDRLAPLLLDALDDLRRATTAAAASDSLASQFVDGLAMIERKFLIAMDALGIEAIEPAGTFDPHLHHAVDAKYLPGAAPNSIVGAYARGYRNRHTGLLVRAALVCVARPASAASLATAESTQSGADSDSGKSAEPHDPGQSEQVES